MALIDSATNFTAVLKQLSLQIDRRISLLEDGSTSVATHPVAHADTIAFLKHIRLVLAGPSDQQTTPPNVTRIRGLKSVVPRNETADAYGITASDYDRLNRINPSG